MLIDSPKFKCSNEILSIASMLSVPNVFVRPKELGQESDQNGLDIHEESSIEVIYDMTHVRIHA